jgi:two-component system, OmpR family, heavy metal sensor histidine kinase CusS
MSDAPVPSVPSVQASSSATPSVARTVARSGAVTIALALVLVGAGTSALLHVRGVRALDEALLAAALGRAHPDLSAKVEVEMEHSRSAVDTWLVRAQDPRVPPAAVRAALRSQRPLFVDAGERRIVLLRFELEDSHDDDEHEGRARERAGLAAASARRITWLESAGPFLLFYSLLALAVSAAAAWVLSRVVRRAFLPIDHARHEASRVVALGSGQRLTAQGPIEVRALLEALNALLERLESASHAQTRFTAEAAHELRTPVTTMLGELDVALRSERTPKQYREVLASTRDEADRLRKLVEGLTALARIDAGHGERGRELVHAAELASAALSSEAGALKHAGNTVSVEIVTDSELEAQRSLVEVALGNLLRNAARHAPGTAVTLRVSTDGTVAVFEVEDAGPGVPPEAREALFDRFARSGEARRRDRAGLGLGLSLAREVARRHGGDCTLEASPLGGLRARLTVRLTTKQAAQQTVGQSEV